MIDQFSMFLEAYKAAPQSIKEFIDSEKIGTFVDTLGTDASLKPKLLVIISNRVLNITKDSDMVTALESLLGNEIASIGKIKSFITEAVSGEPATTPTNTTTSPEVISAVRTMAGDSKQIGYSSTEEQTYTTMQSAIINERK